MEEHVYLAVSAFAKNTLWEEVVNMTNALETVATFLKEHGCLKIVHGVSAAMGFCTVSKDLRMTVILKEI